MPDRIAAIATVVEEGGESFLIIGEGDHTCDRWKIRPSLLIKLALELVSLALKR